MPSASDRISAAPEAGTIGLSVARVEALNPAAESIRIRGFNALLEIKLLGPIANVGLTGIYASGQDPGDHPAAGGDDINVNAISANYVLGNILVNNEITSDRDGGSIGGLTAIRLTLERPFWNRLDGELVVIWAQLTESPGSGIDSDLGWEIDFNTTYPFSDHLVWKSGLGILFSGEAWELGP